MTVHDATELLVIRTGIGIVITPGSMLHDTMIQIIAVTLTLTRP